MDATRILADAWGEISQIFDRDLRDRAPGRSSAELLELSCDAIDAVIALPPVERDQVFSHIGALESKFLHSIALSMASANLNGPSSRWLRYGLLAIVIENCADEPRRTLAKLGLLFHSAQQTRIDIAMVYDEIKWVALPRMQEMIEGYFANGVHDIRALGWTEAMVNGKRTFKPLYLG